MIKHQTIEPVTSAPDSASVTRGFGELRLQISLLNLQLLN